jgi:hypothetical protein
MKEIVAVDRAVLSMRGSDDLAMMVEEMVKGIMRQGEPARKLDFNQVEGVIRALRTAV